MLSVEQLRNPSTRAAVLEWLLEILKSAGFQTTGWQKGRIQRTLMTAFAECAADLTELAKGIVEFAFNDTAAGDPLNEFSKSRFANAKTPAQRARGPLTLRSVASIPYTVEPLQLIAATASGIEFRNISGGTIPAGSPSAPSATTLIFEARVAGISGGMVGVGEIDRLLTPLAGVTVSNDQVVGGVWYTVAPADEESDASIRERNRTKWATLSVELIAEAYENIARNAGAAKVSVDDNNPRGAGTIDIYVSGELSLLGTAEMQAIQAEFARRAFQTEPTWSPDPHPTSRAWVRHAWETPVTLSGTVYYVAGTVDIASRVTLALDDLARRIPLGGFPYSPGLLTIGDILETIENVEGVRTVILNPRTDIPVAPRSLVRRGAPNWGLTFTPVTG